MLEMILSVQGVEGYEDYFSKREKQLTRQITGEGKKMKLFKQRTFKSCCSKDEEGSCHIY